MSQPGRGEAAAAPSVEAFADSTFGAVLASRADTHRAQDALVHGARRLTFAQFDAAVTAFAHRLLERGLRKGDCCAVLLPNSLEFIVAQYAILRIGAVFLPLSTRYRRYELSYMLRHSQARLLICVEQAFGTDFVALVEELRPELPDLFHVMVQGPAARDWCEPLGPIAELTGEPPDLAAHAAYVAPAPSDLASIMFTSGSTGTPKGVLMTHRNILWDGVRVVERLRITDRDSFLLMLPLSHVFASFVLLTHAVMSGGKTVVMDTFEAGEALRLLAAERLSMLYGVPTMFQMMLAHPSFDGAALRRSVRSGYISGASIPVELIERIRDDMGCDICAAFGMTEGNCISITEIDDPPDVKARTVGRPLRGEEIRIVDDNRKDVPVGTAGEIAVRGDNIFQRYHAQPELTAAAKDEAGWFHTGDLAMFREEDGRLVIVGRKKDMIIHGGFNVMPAEVEEVILQLSEVQVAAVVGMPDSMYGESVTACVVPKPGMHVERARILEHCRANLATYKVPTRVDVMDELPMTTTGKIQKFALRDLLAREAEPEP